MLSVLLQYIHNITTVPGHIVGIIFVMTECYNICSAIFTVCKILWHVVCQSLHLYELFSIHIGIVSCSCQHTQIQRYKYMLYQRNNIINNDICDILATTAHLDMYLYSTQLFHHFCNSSHHTSTLIST